MFRIVWGLAAVAAAGAGALHHAGVRPGEPLGCATAAEIATYVADFEAKRPTRAIGGAGMAAATCTQDKLIPALERALGPTVGYKAGLTSLPSQLSFGVVEPVKGVLFEKTLLEDGAAVPLDFGARPLIEADLVLVVGDGDALNAAETRAEAIRAIAAVRPFIELPDLAYAPGEPVTAATLTANAVAPRLGVLGAEIPVEDPDAMLAALETMTVTLAAKDGTELASATGASVLGHPVESALWLKRTGVRFKTGDLISVGSIGGLVDPKAAKGAATATYRGLPGDPSVTVLFETAPES